MILKSFGCSFIFGSDLPDISNCSTLTASGITWPALVAKQLNHAYQCHARPGSGNLQILERVLAQCNNATSNDIFVIGWTWIDRFDYINTVPSDWVKSTMLLPKTPWDTILPAEDSALAQTYYKHLHSQYQDKLTSLIYIKTAIDVLQQRNIKFVMTYIDNLIFETEWQPNTVISELQKYIWPHTTRFEGKNFLDWSQSQGFEISPAWHPLAPAHQSASEYIMHCVFDKKNTSVPTQQVLS